MDSGLVFNIQRYSLHDGPGIRSTVFFKGCPLNCWWCHNPESQDRSPEVRVVESRCLRCGECFDACPQQGAGPMIAEAAHCTRCGACVAACPSGAREMMGRRMTVEEVVQEVLRDRLFYDDSGGGVTISGGEPLLQPVFLRALVRSLREHSVHVAVDTCGYASQAALLSIAPDVNLFLYDLKAIDDPLHMRHTGVSNRVILDNLQRLAQVHDQIWIRVPLIPGFNSDELPQIAQFVSSISSIRQVHILPYHELGLHKRTRGPEPPQDTIESPSEQQLQAAADTFRACGLNALIGG